MLLLILNLAAGSTAATIYIIWAFRWANRKRPLLAILNAVASATALGFAISYALILTDHTRLPGVQVGMLRPLISLALLTPAITRFLELRLDERREAITKNLQQGLK